MRNITTLIASLIIVTNSVFAQTTTISAEPKPYIEVTGTAEKEIIPDEIYIAIVIRERMENREKVTIAKQDEALKKAIESLGISVSNLSLSDANADYVRVNWKSKDVLTKKSYVLKVGDAATVGKVFEQLDTLVIRDAYISKTSHSKIDEFKKEVRINAIKAAKNKADYLLEAIGEATGKALVVVDNPNGTVKTYEDQQYSPRRYYANSNVQETIKYEGNNEEIQFQKIKLSASVYVKFGIK